MRPVVEDEHRVEARRERGGHGHRLGPRQIEHERDVRAATVRALQQREQGLAAPLRERHLGREDRLHREAQAHAPGRLEGLEQRRCVVGPPPHARGREVRREVGHGLAPREAPRDVDGLRALERERLVLGADVPAEVTLVLERRARRVRLLREDLAAPAQHQPRAGEGCDRREAAQDVEQRARAQRRAPPARHARRAHASLTIVGAVTAHQSVAPTWSRVNSPAARPPTTYTP